jgi:NADH-quinone oxidoreductase subunit E
MKSFNRSSINQEGGESLLALLQDMQRTLGYLPKEALRHASAVLQIPLSKLFSLATFYNAFSLVQTGKSIISVCLGTACHVKNGDTLTKMLGRELGLQQGEGTTADARFTVKKVRCLGCCSIAPVIKINETVYGHMTQTKINSVLKKYQKK